MQPSDTGHTFRPSPICTVQCTMMMLMMMMLMAEMSGSAHNSVNQANQPKNMPGWHYSGIYNDSDDGYDGDDGGDGDDGDYGDEEGSNQNMPGWTCFHNMAFFLLKTAIFKQNGSHKRSFG